MRSKVALASFGAVLLASSSVWAAAPGGQVSYDESSANYRPPPTERRGGFAMAFTSGYGVGEYQGYPLSVEALNDPNGERTTGLSLATDLKLWMGGSPRDWFTTGVGVSLVSAQNRALGAGMLILMHVEFFPLFYRGGTFQNLGVGLDGGLGVITLFDKEDKEFEEPIAESGSLSTLALSVFWEPIRFWNVSMGPSATYTHGFSQTMQVNQFTLGFRAALYGVQPKKKRRGS